MAIESQSPLLNFILGDAHERVVKAKDRFRPVILEAVKAECRLTMQHNDDSNQQHRKASVPVTVETGLSPELIQLDIPESLLEAFQLARYRHSLENAANSTRELAAMLNEERSNSLLRSAPLQELIHVSEWSEQLSKTIQENDPVKFILNFKTDVLGCFIIESFTTNPQEVNRARIVLYSGAISIFSQLLNCKIEDLTAVVLTHEYCHAYTQLGADIDGNRWPSAHYVCIEPELCEGLAQYYTDRALARLEDKIPRALSVFEKILAYQPPVYHAHTPWEACSPEAVRRAMLESRTWNDQQLQQFEGRLSEANKLFPANPRPRIRNRYDY